MSVKFKKVLLDKSNKCEACSVADFDRDGNLEIMCGEYIYYGKNFDQKRKICEITYDGDYVHDFSNYPIDVNGDGWLDIITGSWWSEGLYWRENPKNSTDEWKTHKICGLSNVETIRYFDIDGDGTDEIFPNTPCEPQSFFKLVKDSDGKPTGEMKKYVIGGTKDAGHGLGFGDINGDGKVDILLCDGWLEQPEDVYSSDWIFHPDYNIPAASVPMICHDINGDGLNDIIVGAGHNYGLWWLEQTIVDGKRGFIKHEIEMTHSQYHDMQLLDIDGDGKLELVTGARHNAHNGNDPGEKDPIGTYIFKLEGTQFTQYTLDLGMPDTASGTGIYFWIADLTGNGKLDLVLPGKEGLYIFYNECEI